MSAGPSGNGPSGSEADRLIASLDLAPHPEGGYFRETFRDASSAPDGRAFSTAIYFILKAGEVSRWHRIDAAEIWHWYRGAPLELSIAETGRTISRRILGNDPGKGEVPQVVVPAHAWQMARSLGNYSWLGCTVAPCFEFAHFELAPAGFTPA